MVEKKKNEKCTIFVPKGNSYCRRKSSARGLWFKVSSEGQSTEIDILIRSPIEVQTGADCTRQLAVALIMSITTDAMTRRER